MCNEREIQYCLDIIERAQKLINQLTNSGKNKEVKRTAGKLILMERKNIKAMKTKLILLGTTYESEIEQYTIRQAIASGRQSGKNYWEYPQRYGSINTPSARGKIGIA